ncbi:MAG: ATP-dependent sacrificial sulfur transferase LarE [Lachnospiraceae bacterium]|nr:ATP-dependent sacrificial sulfur transferase LarE [Lachnospiraceae bacterium]
MTLEEYFESNRKVALAFSGGTDSAFLLYSAKRCGVDVKAYYVKSAFQPQFEMDDAIRLAGQLGADMEILNVDVLAVPEVAANPEKRCYYCKRAIFGTITEAALKDGYTVVMDGTNASDDDSDRPGIRAVKELSVHSPLRLCGLTKDLIRELSKEAGLFTWNKPAYACLATRVPTGTAICPEILEATEKAEDYLFSLGFYDFRVRYLDGAAKIQVVKDQLPMIIEHREEIFDRLKEWYKAVYLDLSVRK